MDNVVLKSMLQETEKKEYIHFKNVIVQRYNVSPSRFSWWQRVIGLCFAPQWVSGVHHPTTVMAFHLSLCSILSPFLCVFLCCCHLCHSNGGNFNWDVNKQQQSPLRREPASPVSPRRDLQRIARKMPSQRVTPSQSWESHCGKGGTRKGGEEEGACHLSLQDSCKVLIMCVLFIPCLCSLTISWETFQRKGGEE